MEVSKNEEGRIIYGIPTGKNVSRFGIGALDPYKQVKKLKILKVRKKGVTLLSEGVEDRYHHSSYSADRVITSDGSRGYRLFRSKEEVARAEEYDTLYKLIFDKFSNLSADPKQLSYEQTTAIASVLGLSYET